MNQQETNQQAQNPGDRQVVVHGCDTLCELFHKRVTGAADKVAIREKDFGIWNEYTWADFGDQARLVGLGLKALGLNRGDVCSVASEVNKEWMFTDLGVICVGGVVNGVYPTDASNQVEYLVNDSQTRFYFAEDEEQLDKVLTVRDRTPTLEKIIIFDMEGLRNLDDEQCLSFDSLLDLGKQYLKQHPDCWEHESAAAQPSDLIILAYTSGTTGQPKGAMISHRNALFQASAIQNSLGLHQTDEQLGFLPLAHIAGRAFYTLCAIEACSTINLVENLETTIEDCQEVAPTAHFSVPRVWEKHYSTVAIKLKEATALGRLAYKSAITVSERVMASRARGEKAPLIYRALYPLIDRFVFRNIRQLLGIDRCRWLSTAAAPIAPELIGWYWTLGRPMYEVYGQTECSGLATANMPGDYRIGSVGKPIEGVEVKLSEQEEILIRGPGVIAGYWNQPEMTAKTIRDGWLHTGDVGRMDEDGFLYVVDRMRDIIITAGGKNISPSAIENQLKFSPYISDAVVVGDKRPYLVCLIMIDLDNVTKFAQDHDVPFTNYASLCHTHQVRDLVQSEIETVNAKFARVETIKKFRLIDQLLDAEDEELTPTMKLKRKVVNVKYHELIESMYGE